MMWEVSPVDIGVLDAVHRKVLMQLALTVSEIRYLCGKARDDLAASVGYFYDSLERESILVNLRMEKVMEYNMLISLFEGEK